ncbi:hypothetical protein GCM10010392_65710 [Streptomyces clavifer]|nr:hypothetical protein GCM10010392_65710 [Streptomyces clavifer]
MNLVVDPGAQHGADTGRQDGEQEQRDQQGIQHRQHAPSGDHADHRRHEPLRVGHHHVGTRHPHLGRLAPVGEAVLRVCHSLHSAHRLDERRVRHRRQQRRDPPLRVRGYHPGGASQCRGKCHHQQCRQCATQPAPGGPGPEYRPHGAGGGGQEHCCRDAREQLAAEK